ncbi:uncharacterized protein LOC122559235 [Chiloscyllium plagiosum]|uniref:uncharacterized protein LOC122559235 n=1 Tax=Chiloscyllium plagiosum TaxID=36176 RepID=UPI001CB819BB|nr:uncharacterized protein LOC122559235 [Chiloscyllium plagiosum]
MFEGELAVDGIGTSDLGTLGGHSAPRACSCYSQCIERSCHKCASECKCLCVCNVCSVRTVCVCVFNSGISHGVGWGGPHLLQYHLFTVSNSFRTDPACRFAVWNVPEILENTNGSKQSAKAPIIEGVCLSPFDSSLWKVPVCECCCITCLSSHIYYNTSEGLVCADSDEFILLGLEDGRILFMDVLVESVKYHEMQAHKGAVILIKHDMDQNQLLSLSRDTSEKRLKIWSLPKLQLLHELPIPRDVVTFSRIASQLCLGLESGMILFNDIVATNSLMLSFSPTVSQDVKNESGEKQHLEQPAIAVITDACPKQSIFLSCR